MRYLYIIISIGLVCAGFGWTLKSYGDSREAIGYAKAIQAQTNTSLQHLVAWADQQQIISQQVQNGIQELGYISENPISGPNVRSAFNSLRRSESGLPDSAYIPSPPPPKPSQ